MNITSVIIGIIAAALLGVVVDWLLKLILPTVPKLPRIVAGILASVILVVLVAWPAIMQLSMMPATNPSINPSSSATNGRTITVDGLVDDWKNIGCVEIPDNEADLVQLDEVSDPQAAKWIDYKRICYRIQEENLYILMEFFSPIRQYDPETKLIGYGVTFRQEPKSETSPILSVIDIIRNKIWS